MQLTDRPGDFGEAGAGIGLDKLEEVQKDQENDPVDDEDK